MKTRIWTRRIGYLFGDTYKDFMSKYGDKSDSEFEQILLDNAQKIMGALMDEYGYDVSMFNEMR